MGFVTIDDHHILAHPQPAWLNKMMVYVKLGVKNTSPVEGCAGNQSLNMEVDCDVGWYSLADVGMGHAG